MLGSAVDPPITEVLLCEAVGGPGAPAGPVARHPPATGPQDGRHREAHRLDRAQGGPGHHNYHHYQTR